ncbi:integrator complex subunit 2 isoform X2 [Nematostella vectensis]|uniref:integrator complex subunit 2 isoform X1 n=1 Tax=Nematostella vectensis TaxID=45351 RepID=UPI002077361B|nr:integrator complex subunit 2 isoform X1 [Nematostella vectensis]XP_048582668.1 integrator complex subunit 2 isoform X2 [Nematostella vectensis]
MDIVQYFPTARAFRAIRSASVTELSKLDNASLRPLLPCLVRMALCSPVDQSVSWTEARKEVQKILSGLEIVNSIVALLSVDFSFLEQDALKELQLRKKVGGGAGASVLVESLQNELALEFERSEPSRRLRLILSELLRIMSKLPSTEEFLPEKSELFECEIYLEEVSDVLCIAQAELPSLLPLEQVAEALLRVKYGPWLLCRLVANVPDNFEQVCHSLLENGESQDDSALGGMVRTIALRQLCAMDPSHALTMRAKATRLCRLPGLAIALTLDFGADDSGSDLVAFLSGIMFGGDLKSRTWFSEFIKIGQRSSSSMLHSLRAQLLKDVTSLVSSKDQQVEGLATHSIHEDKETLEILQAMEVNTDFEVVEEVKPSAAKPMHAFEIAKEKVLYGSALLKLYCGLKNIAGMKLTRPESDSLLSLITCHPPPSAAGVRFVVVGLCTLLACPHIVSTPENEQAAINWIKWLSKEESHYEAASGMHASFGEVLLLISIHFHGNQLESVAELVSSILGMRVRPGSLSRMKALFTQELFPEKVVAAHAVTVPVTPQLSANDTGFLPIHCVHQLLKTRAFTKHSVAVKDWVYKQLCTCVTPLHSLIPGLVEAYVNTVITPLHGNKVPRKQVCYPTQDGFTEAEILAVFKQVDNKDKTDSSGTSLVRHPSVYITNDTEKTSSFAPRLLMLYYVLLYQDMLLNNMKNLVTSNVQHQSYSSGLLAHIPIKYLVHQARARPAEYRGLYAPILRLLFTHYPHLCLVDEWLVEEELMNTPQNQGIALQGDLMVMDVQCSPFKLKQAFNIAHDRPTAAMLLLTKLQTLEPSQLIPYMDPLVRSLPLLLLVPTPRRLLTLCCDIWTRLSTIIPRKLWLATVNVLCHEGPQPYTDEDLARDPLTVLRCDRRVFRCPPMFDIVVRVLLAYLAASRTMLSQHLHTQQAPRTNSAVEQEREELRVALVAAQESAAVQLLLEICLPNEQDKQEESCSMHSCVLREIKCRVCSSLHQMFIADPSLAKLVHFQSYPLELLPVTVAGIPSMHICLDFIPELVNQTQLDKQLFGIQLASYLVLQYPLPKSLNVAKYILSRMSSLLVALPASSREAFFRPALPSLVRFCRAFPPLHVDATPFLIQLGKVAASHAVLSTNSSIGVHDSLLARLAKGLDPLEISTDHEDHGFNEDVQSVSSVGDEGSSDLTLCVAVEKTFSELVRLAVVNQQGVNT